MESTFEDLLDAWSGILMIAVGMIYLCLLYLVTDSGDLKGREPFFGIVLIVVGTIQLIFWRYGIDHD